MKILKGVIVDVLDKGTPEKPWAIVGIQAESVNRNGMKQFELFELSVFGDAVKNGLHNVYRAQKGVEVYAPFSVNYNERYKELNYQLAGIPLRLDEARPVQPVSSVPQKSV
ncbi:hypothetical protein ACOI7N_27235 [Pseudomonas sp. P2758]|uniref:hypothetical protein n=1 Tax=Pseudomonas sp. P2758 TaxID=3409916 RepID=UPI003B5985B5